MLRYLVATLLARVSMPGSAVPAAAQEVLDPSPNTLPSSQDWRRQPNGLAQTPPTGWNSWNNSSAT